MSDLHAVQLPFRPATIDEPVAHWAKEKPDELAVDYGPRSWTCVSIVAQAPGRFPL